MGYIVRRIATHSLSRCIPALWCISNCSAGEVRAGRPRRVKIFNRSAIVRRHCTCARLIEAPLRLLTRTVARLMLEFPPARGRPVYASSCTPGTCWPASSPTPTSRSNCLLTPSAPRTPSSARNSGCPWAPVPHRAAAHPREPGPAELLGTWYGVSHLRARANHGSTSRRVLGSFWQVAIDSVRFDHGVSAAYALRLVLLR
jgi:hypothetical protein